MKTAARGGFALVVVLSMLVLMLGLTLAYFSRVSLDRQINSFSTSRQRVELLSRSALHLVLADLSTEMEAGSEPDPLALGVTVKEPLRVTDEETGRTYAPSAVPQRVADDGVPAIVKKSRGGTPFFEQAPREGYRATPVASNRASTVSTTEPSLNGRRIVLERWNKPRLMTEEEFASFVAPDWIYIDRKGQNPTGFTEEKLKALADHSPGNENHVLGRFAYVVYDEGGLIDINVVGNALGTEANSRRGRMHQVSLDGGVGEVAFPRFDKLIDWRSPLSGTRGDDAPGSLFDPRRNFLKPLPGEQAFVNRQDLIRYALQSGAGGPLPPAALPYLTTFSRAVNAPGFAPDFDGTTPPVVPAPEGLDESYEMNPPFLSVRYPGKTVLKRPGEDPVRVEAGTPVMVRRFPLGKLSLLSEETPDVEAIRYYFGLERQSDGSWLYVADHDRRIARLKEVAHWSELDGNGERVGREPNFFEILQAAIHTGSLGRHAGESSSTEDSRRDNAATISYPSDSLMNRQVLQIGANIMDQWDQDNLPTEIRYPSGVAGETIAVYGVENLPYLSQVSLIPIRPRYHRDLFQLWAVFTVWNPHQNAVNPPSEVEQFRIVPTGGESKVWLTYRLSIPNPTDPSDTGKFYQPLYDNRFDLGCYYEPTWSSFVEINSGREECSFENGDFSEPTTIRGQEPKSPEDQPGLLLVGYQLNEGDLSGAARPNAAIPAKANRPAALQKELNDLFDIYFGYTVTPPENSDYDDGAGGERVYPPGTTLSFAKSGSTDHWVVEETEEGVQVYAKFGAKAHNVARHRPKANDPLSFELQAKVNGQWRTYQRIEGWYGWSETMIDRREDIEDAADNTHHSADDAPLHRQFYRWRQAGTFTNSYQMIDPRSVRFGFSAVNYNSLNSQYPSPIGVPLQAVADSWSGSGFSEEDAARWLRLWGNYQLGLGVASKTPVAGFEFFKTNYALPLGLVTNHPDLLNGAHPMRYHDLDGVIRPADGYWGARPTLPTTSSSGEAPGIFSDRPVILNRPFRSVGELGHVFRDLPFKTVDFSSERSADLGLLDVFSLEESTGEVPLVAGKVDLNTRRSEVLATLLRGSEKRRGGINPEVAGSVMSQEEADVIAQKMVSESMNRPFLYKGDLIKRVLGLMDGAATDSNPLPATERKAEREATIRTLSALGATHTWTLMIDLLVQNGRFTMSSRTGGDFQVSGEERWWVHVAIDRRTGAIVDLQKEVVHE